MFVSGSKQPLRLQARLQLFKSLLEGACPQRFQIINQELIITPGLINAQPGAADNPHPVFQIKQHPGPRKWSAPDGGAKDDGPDLAVLVFQGKIHMARGRPMQIGNLAFHPEKIKALFQKLFDQAI